MKEFTTKQSSRIINHLETSTTNGCDSIIGLQGDAVFILKRGPFGCQKCADFKWLCTKTGLGYNLSGTYKTIEDACNGLIEKGGRVLIFESKSMDDCKEIQERLLKD